MSINILEKPVLISDARLAFGLENIDKLFAGFTLGDFGVLYGLPTCLPLSLLLSVNCQLPAEQGGLDSPAIFVDGGNSFDLYEVSRIAQQRGLDPKTVLERIFISRAFTAHQLTSLIADKLKLAVNKYAAKLVIISDVLGLYLDQDVPKKEATDTFNKLTISLSRFAMDNRVIVVATHFSRNFSGRSKHFESLRLHR